MTPKQSSGLAKRAEQRRRAREATTNRNLSSRPRARALAFLQSLPTKHLIAVHRAAKQFIEKQNTTDTTP